MVFCSFQGVGKGYIGNKWVNILTAMQITWPLTTLSIGSHELFLVERDLEQNFVTSRGNITKNMKVFF